MGGKRLEIKKIENGPSRHATFWKRRIRLIKEATELATSCDAEVCLFIFSSKGKLYEYSSQSNMHRSLLRYKKTMESQSCTQEQDKGPEYANLLDAYMKMNGNKIDELSLEELQELEHQSNVGLSLIKARKEKVLLDQVSKSELREQQAMVEIEKLRNQIMEFEETRGPSSQELNPLPLPFTERYFLKDAVNESTSECEEEDDSPATALQLGLPFQCGTKNKKPKTESN